jgi:hypothetical protein
VVHVRSFLLSLVRLHSPSLALGLLIGIGAAGCGRTELDVLDYYPPLAPVEDAAQDASEPDAGLEAEAEAEAAPPVEHTVDTPDAAPPPAVTAAVDPCANMPPVPCPGGGYEYCVAGHYSECPMRCSVCVPGSSRVCFITYCKSWGVQTCASDGLSFGACEESSPPSQCAPSEVGDKPSPALEQCCINSGNCCQDLFDLNGNGDTSDQVGSCSGTTC